MSDSDSGGDVDLSNLTNAIVQCFTIILFGYVAGRAGIINSAQASGIGAFTSKFCLPALIFRSMCQLDFSSVNWMFLLGIFLSKTFLFALVALATVAIKRPLDMGLAGIFAVYSTQSNDFAFGYPIVQAIYADSHPDYVKYLYLIAPMSLAILNPIGFVMMELQKRLNNRNTDHKLEFGTVFLKVLKDILLNPVVNMTVIGIAANFIFGGELPAILDNILEVLDNAFSAGALFFLGHSLVGKIQGKMGKFLLVPFLLVVAKTLLLPLFAWGLVQRLDTSNSSASYSMYAFLYGTIPSAPTVYIFATDFGFGQDIVATALVMGTALSAPFMFISAKMMTVVADQACDFKSLLNETSFDISIVSMIGCIWVILLFIFTGKWKRIPHRFTMAYMVSHVIGCIGVILYYNESNKSVGQLYPGLIMLFVGVFGARFWSAVMAVVLCLLHVRSLCSVLLIQPWLYFIGFGIPLVLTGLLFIVGNVALVDEVDLTFHYGSIQAIFSLTALLICFGVTVTAILWWQREERHHHTIQSRDQSVLVQNGKYRQEMLDEDDSDSSSRKASPPVSPGSPRTYGLTPETSYDGERRRLSGAGSSDRIEDRPKFQKATSIEDIVPYGDDKPDSPPSSDFSEMHHSATNSVMEHISERTCLLGQCSPQQRQDCVNMIRNYARSNLEPDSTPYVEYSDESGLDIEDRKYTAVGRQMMEEYQSFSHLILLLPLIFSMFVAIILCSWKLFKGETTGIYIEVEFLDVVLNYGQGILVLLVFGFESKIIFSPVARRMRRAVFGSEILRLPQWSELEDVTRHTCKQFEKYHLENCRKEIVRDRRVRGETLSNVFTGTAMCDWLISCGLASDRSTAVEYGCHLILGRIIAHMTGEQNFHDTPYFYKFQDNYEQLPV